ncbi:hypothetical protein SOVF_171770, partial [Spinacia oleracea]
SGNYPVEVVLDSGTVGRFYR